MKGVIVMGIRDFVQAKYNVNLWEKVNDECGLRTKILLPMTDINDSQVDCIITKLAKYLDVPESTILEEFGRWWVAKVAPKEYGIFYKSVDNLYDFLLNVSKIHEVITSNIKNAKPPKFQIIPFNDREILFKYISERQLLPLAIGAVKGAADYFHETINVFQISDNEFKVVLTGSEKA